MLHIKDVLLLIKKSKEGNVLFNDTLNTFYLQLYGVRHMVKDHCDSEKGNLLLTHRLLFPINSKGFLYAPSHRQDSTYHSLCYTSRGALAGMRNSSMGSTHEESIRWPIAPWANALTTEIHLIPQKEMSMKWQQQVSSLTIWIDVYHISNTV